jgi:hypothetical protein
MIDFSEFGLFKTSDGRKITYEDLLSDIYENTEEDRQSIKILVDQMTSLISSPSDAVALMEHITNLLDARVKNSDILVKVASIVSRIIQRGMTSTDSTADWEISEEEKKQLLSEAESLLDRTQPKLDEGVNS